MDRGGRQDPWANGRTRRALSDLSPGPFCPSLGISPQSALLWNGRAGSLLFSLAQPCLTFLFLSYAQGGWQAPSYQPSALSLSGSAQPLPI